MQNSGEHILKEQEVLRCIRPKTKNKLMDLLVSYIFDNYSMYPTTNEIILVANATVEIFDKLKDDQGGIVSILSSHIRPFHAEPKRNCPKSFDFFYSNLHSHDI